MHIKNLYTYRISRQEDGRIEASLSINALHPIYRGHFPGMPVTPGVCQVLMVREILEGALEHGLELIAAKQIKFTAVHEPGKDAEIDALISFSQAGDRLMADARLFRNEKVFLKFRGEYRT